MMPATLTLLDRDLRRSVALPATVRQNGAPIDVEIRDLSATGFSAVSTIVLEIGSEVGVAWAEGGRHDAIVVRYDRGTYGFEFKHPLGVDAVAKAATVDNVVEIAAEIANPLFQPFDAPEVHVEKWSRRARATFIVGSAVSSWIVLGLAGWAMYALVA